MDLVHVRYSARYKVEDRGLNPIWIMYKIKGKNIESGRENVSVAIDQWLTVGLQGDILLACLEERCEDGLRVMEVVMNNVHQE